MWNVNVRGIRGRHVSFGISMSFMFCGRALVSRLWYRFDIEGWWIDNSVRFMWDSCM